MRLMYAGIEKDDFPRPLSFLGSGTCSWAAEGHSWHWAAGPVLKVCGLGAVT